MAISTRFAAIKHAWCLLAALLTYIGAAAQTTPEVEINTYIDSISPTQGCIVVELQIPDEYHIYGTTAPEGLTVPITLTSLSVLEQPGLKLEGEPQMSREPFTHNDPMFGVKIDMWEDSLTIRQPFSLEEGTPGAWLFYNIQFMACTSTSCSSPVDEDMLYSFGNVSDIPLPKEAEELQAILANIVDNSDNPLWSKVDDNFNDSLSVSSANNAWWQLLGLGFAGGLLALLTPCVWPMIPMTVSFFLKTNKNRRKSIQNALIYALSIVLIFVTLGMLITLIFDAGKLNALSTSPVFNVLFFLLLVVFAISFFGAFDIKLPAKWSNYIDEKAESTTGILSIFFMSFTLVLVSFSCTGPIIGTLLVEAATKSSIIGPLMGMTGFAMGLALPFGLFAIFPSFLNSMPKSGGWLNSVKVVLGFIELILSLKFLSVADLACGWRILDREVFVSLWIVLFVLLGMYLLGKLRFSHDSEQKHTSVLGLFLATISFAFAVYMLPGLWGAPLKSISAFAPPAWTQDFNLYGHEYTEFDDYDKGMAYAKQTGKPVLVDFTGYGCVNCRKMDVSVFDNPSIHSTIDNNYVLIRLYVDDKAAIDEPYTVIQNGKKKKIKTIGDKWTNLQVEKFMTSSQPYYVLLDNDGNPLAPPRAYKRNVGEFQSWLNDGINEYAKR